MQPTRVLEARIIIACWQWISPSQTENIKLKYEPKPQTSKKIVCKCFTLSYNCNRLNNYTNQCIFFRQKKFTILCPLHMSYLDGDPGEKSGKWKVAILKMAPCHPFCAPHSAANCTRLLCCVERSKFGFNVDVICELVPISISHSIYRPQTKFGEGNVFTDVCLFTGGRGRFPKSVCKTILRNKNI